MRFSKRALGVPQWLSSTESACNAGDTGDAGLISGQGRSLGDGYGNPLQYFCLKNPMDKRSLAGYNPWGHKESDMTDRLNTHKMMTNPQLTPHSTVKI